MRLSREDFIKRGNEVHDNKYDYSKVDYINSRTKVCIICPEHGEFWQVPYSHLKGYGCSECNGRIKWDTQRFIKEGRKVHNNKYDYSKVEYIDNRTKVCIICSEHGEFWQTPEKHLLRQQGCPKCQGRYRTTEEFIEIVKKIHGNKYDYSKTVYTGSHKKLDIICQKHGIFSMTAKDHINGQGCPKCKCEKISLLKKDTQETFLEKLYKIHQNKYDTSKVNYIKSNIKICLICHKKAENGKEHGEFWVTPNQILSGGQCPKCQGRYKTTEEIIAEFKKIHGNKYDYSKTNYNDSHTKVIITCPEHGDFTQLPYSHLQGCGCPQCVLSHIENEINETLKNNHIKLVYESNIGGVLKRQSVDFYLPEYNVAVECQGGQHFYGAFNRKDEEKANKIHKNVLRRDIRKFNILKEHNIRIFYFTNINDLPKDIFTNKKYKGMYNENNFFTDKKKLLEKIKGE